MTKNYSSANNSSNQNSSNRNSTNQNSSNKNASNKNASNKNSNASNESNKYLNAIGDGVFFKKHRPQLRFPLSLLKIPLSPIDKAHIFHL